MEKLEFTASINAPKEKVWEVLWNDDSYRKWTSVFCEGSYAETEDWKEGSKVLFLSPDKSGMVSRVASNKPYEYMSFEHLGEVKDGVEDTESEKVKGWAGSHENYILKEENGVTRLKVELDSTGDFKDYFEKTWPGAMEKIKDLAESN